MVVVFLDGPMKCRKNRMSEYHIILDFSLFKNFLTNRAANGSAVSGATSEMMSMNINSYHFTKEPWYTKPSSYIVHKGSPLQVGKDN